MSPGQSPQQGTGSQWPCAGARPVSGCSSYRNAACRGCRLQEHFQEHQPRFRGPRLWLNSCCWPCSWVPFLPPSVPRACLFAHPCCEIKQLGEAMRLASNRLLPSCLKCPCNSEQRGWEFCNGLAQALGSSSIPALLRTVPGPPRGRCRWDPFLLGMQRAHPAASAGKVFWQKLRRSLFCFVFFFCSVFSFFLSRYLFISLAVR